MMNLSIMTTAVPALGRLVIELQPSLYAFTIDEDPIEAPLAVDKYRFSSMGNSFSQNFFGNQGKHPASSVQVTSGWRESFKSDAESMQGLVNPPNTIKQTIHFEVH